MTPADVIAEVRPLLQDTVATYRYSDAVLLGFVNDTLTRMVTLRPDLFTTVGEITLVQNVVLQEIPAGGIRLVEVFNVKNGSAIEEVDRDLLNRTEPTWTSATAGIPNRYMRHQRNPRKFFVSPRPTAGVIVLAEYVASPTKYVSTATTIAELPNGYFSILVDGVVFLAQSVDDEHVSSGRAKLFYDSFIQGLGGSAQSRILTDLEDGGVFSQGAT